MIKLLLTLIVRYIDGGYNRVRATEDDITIVIYKVTNKLGVNFTRIDIFTKERERESNGQTT